MYFIYARRYLFASTFKALASKSDKTPNPTNYSRTKKVLKRDFPHSKLSNLDFSYLKVHRITAKRK